MEIDDALIAGGLGAEYAVVLTPSISVALRPLMMSGKAGIRIRFPSCSTDDNRQMRSSNPMFLRFRAVAVTSKLRYSLQHNSQSRMNKLITNQ